MKDSLLYACPTCTAQCTFEAMNQCHQQLCITDKFLKLGIVVDRRPNDLNPKNPTNFTYVDEKTKEIIENYLEFCNKGNL